MPGTRDIRKLAATIVVLYLGVSVAEAVLHSHPMGGGSVSVAISSHDCGSQEVHQPIAKVVCLPCLLGTHAAWLRPAAEVTALVDAPEFVLASPLSALPGCPTAPSSGRAPPATL